MSEKTEKQESKEIAETEGNVVAIPSEDFGGYDANKDSAFSVQKTYNEQYGLLLVLRNETFKLINPMIQDKKEQVLLSFKDGFECQVVYGHTLYKLRKGDIERYVNSIEMGGKDLPEDSTQWPEEMLEVLAVAYGQPKDPTNPMRGNFDANGYGDFLDDKEKRKWVKKRQLIIMTSPAFNNKLQPVLASFGGSAMQEFNQYIKLVESKKRPDGGFGYPVPAVVCQVTAIEKQRQNSDAMFSCPTFRPAVHEDDPSRYVLALHNNSEIQASGIMELQADAIKLQNGWEEVARTSTKVIDDGVTITDDPGDHQPE